MRSSLHEVGLEDFLKTLAEAWQIHADCLMRVTTLPVQGIAARVQSGTTKEAKSVLHQLARGDHPRKPARADEPCAQLKFQSTV